MEERKASFLELVTQHSDIALAVVVVAIISVLVIPIPPGLLDFALAFNIAFSIVILIATLYIRNPLELSVFPGMLLIITLIRLSLNVASTRLILGEAFAGDVINSFGNFVVKGNYVVGFVIFIILVIIQFVVITKGAGRISEVAARFTLDAMPGKQMAIDADLNSGLISDAEARQRRSDIAREADFYGAMDGASKFVRGDAIAGILITAVNVIGGFIIGVAMNDLTIQESLRTYTLLSVGDGLVTQIPALIVSTASGIIVTRAAATSDMGHDISQQLTFQPRAIMVASGVIFIFGIVPGLPTLPFVALGTVLGLIAYAIDHKQKQEQEEAIREEEEKKEEGPPPERTEDMLRLDTLEVEIGYGLIPLVDANQGGDLLDRVAVIRKQLALEMGLIVPAIRIRDNVQLQPNAYAIKIKGLNVAAGELMPDHIMAINPGYIEDDVDGFETIEPAFQLKARWIIPNLKETAEAKGYTVVEPTAVLATHLTEVIRSNAAEIISRQDVQHLLDNLKEEQPALVDGVVPEQVPLPLVHKVLQLLLDERVPIRDLSTIMETLSDYITATTDAEVLTEYCRMALRRQITDLLKEENKLHVFTLSPNVEQTLSDALQNTKQGMMLVLPPQVTDKIMAATQKQADILATGGHQAICLTSPNVRLAFRRLLEAALPQLIVISYNEVHPDVEVISTGMVELENGN